MRPPIRLVTFDALHTIITPRQPIHVQYSQVFEPYVGVLPPDKIKQSFRVALKAVQKDDPSYDKGAKTWWQDVIRRTAIASGAHEQALDASLSDIVDKLMKRFSSGEGYKAFDDAIPIIRHLHDQLAIRTAVVSNGDSRVRDVLKDLGFPSFLGPIVLSEEGGIEKPSTVIFRKTLDLVNRTLGSNEEPISLEECLHIGDELECDYKGAVDSGMRALLLRRGGLAGEHEHKEEGEDLEGVEVIVNLEAVIPKIRNAADR